MNNILEGIKSMKDKYIENLVEMFKRGPTETTVLSDEDFDYFMEVLENPPEPTEKLKELFERHKQWEKEND